MGYRVPLVLIQHINEQHPSCTELGTAWPEHHVHFGSLKSHPSSLVASHLLSLPSVPTNPEPNTERTEGFSEDVILTQESRPRSDHMGQQQNSA